MRWFCDLAESFLMIMGKVMFHRMHSCCCRSQNYAARAADDRDRYDREMAVYRAAGGALAEADL